MKHYQEKVNGAWMETQRTAVDIVTQTFAPSGDELFDLVVSALRPTHEAVAVGIRNCLSQLKENPKPTFEEFTAQVHEKLKQNCTVFTLKLQHGTPTMSGSTTNNVSIGTMTGGQVNVDAPGSTYTQTNLNVTFEGLRALIEQSGAGEAADAANAAVEQMEQATKSNDGRSFLAGYFALAAIAADHVQLWDGMKAYVPVLTSLAHQFLGC